MKEQAKLMGLTAAWWIFFAVLILAVTAGWLLVRPVILNLETAQNQNSYEYITTIQETLINGLTEWKQLDAEIKAQTNQTVIAAKRASQAAIVTEMHKKAMRIQPDKVPVEVAQFLTTH